MNKTTKTETTYSVRADYNSTRRCPEFFSIDEAYDYIDSCCDGYGIITKLVKDARGEILSATAVR